ncbi:MAG: helix-turn-helix transcriptional regulator [Planctomycetaceae bacterium]|nr:helix-turn-helix transcriptional regulator [Planctomycetaceae bacterium]
MIKQPIFLSLEKRRRELGMSRKSLANRSNVSLPTVNRILSGRHTGASIENVLTIAAALGMELKFEAEMRSERFREMQAVAKARQLVRLVQGTSALEGQGLDKDELEDMIGRTAKELSLSKRKLWEE